MRDATPRKGIGSKNWGMKGGLLISLIGVAPSRMVGVSASVIFHCTIKIKVQKISSGTGSPGTWIPVVPEKEL